MQEIVRDEDHTAYTDVSTVGADGSVVDDGEELAVVGAVLIEGGDVWARIEITTDFDDDVGVCAGPFRIWWIDVEVSTSVC